MDGPLSGPPEAFAKLAALNPTRAPTVSAARPAAPAAAASAAGDDVGFVLLRPAAVQGALVSDICQRFEKRGLSLAGMRMVKPGIDLAKKHYAPRAAAGLPQKELAAIVNALAPGPAIVTLWRGAGALAALRLLAGDDDTARALPGTVRGDLSVAATADPLVEVAADAADVERLQALWFEASDLAATATSFATAPPPPPPHAAKPPTAKPPPPPGDLGRFYITTAINYANGPPHMGHAYEAVAADVLARYHRGYGREVFFLTGADEHGQKIADTAEKQGLKPIELCDRHVAQFIALDKALGCEFDGYVRTTSDAHKAIARKLWTKCEQAGGVYLGNYVGWYNVREECAPPQRSSAPSPPEPPPPRSLRATEKKPPPPRSLAAHAPAARAIGRRAGPL